MALRIQQDHARSKAIVRGKIKQHLRRFVTKGELLGKQGKEVVSIPLPSIDLPHFVYGEKQQGGVGQGEGEPGEVLQPGEGKEGEGKGKAGEGEGQHGLEVDVTLDELADILGEELQLPRIQPRGKEQLVTRKIKYTGINTVGPESLRHFKRTFKQALKRQVASGTYRAEHPVIIPQREDRRYRTFRIDPRPETNAVIVYVMDVSGSMGDEQKEMVRIESFWIDTWLRRHYKGLVTRYVIHDAVAREVDRDTFFHTKESGGTMISSAYKLVAELLEKEHPASSWNTYLFHFSDGDNWSSDDTKLCLTLLRDRLLPAVNLYAYGQVESPYGSGQFIKDLREAVGGRENVALSDIADRDAIYGSIKELLGKGK